MPIPHPLLGEGGEILPFLVRGEEILPYWDQKIDIGTGGPLGSKKIIKSYDFWTLVKPKLN